jgi:4'-phosphopantetheinyl transferase
MMEQLPRDETHVWFVRSERVAPELLAAYEAILSGDERARAHRFLMIEHRHAFVIAHALVRCVLSRYARIEPVRWAFARGAHGRPRVRGGALGELDFNLSHTAGLAVCAVGRGVLGVDVEDLARPAPLEVAGHFFAPREAAALATLVAPLRPRRFYEYWTLKESYIKARGLGLAIPLDQFAFQLGGGERPRIGFAGGIDDDPARWWFELLEPTERHLLAVALRDPPPHARVVMRELLPLGEQLPAAHPCRDSAP